MVGTGQNLVPEELTALVEEGHKMLVPAFELGYTCGLLMQLSAITACVANLDLIGDLTDSILACRKNVTTSFMINMISIDMFNFGILDLQLDALLDASTAVVLVVLMFMQADPGTLSWACMYVPILIVIICATLCKA
jgi:hypothetical protein